MGTYAPLILSMIATTVVATWIGRKLLDRVPEKLFRMILKVILTLLALRLMWVALSESGLF